MTTKEIKMANHGKRYNNSATLVEKAQLYEPAEAMELVKQAASAKFDETVEVSINLGVDPRHGDQMVRGTVNLPFGTGKVPRVAVFAKGEKADQAREAGADEVGDDDLVAKIQGGWREFDRLVASPDMMPVVGRLGRILGPRMPNPKAGTVGPDVAKIVRELKSASRADFRVEKEGIVHAPIGKASFPAENLMANFQTLITALMKAKPGSAKGRYLKGITVSSTMGPGIHVDTQKAQVLAERS
jgi:large subunit ribosomal protein L1